MSGFKRWIFNAIGLFSVAMGVIGLFLPVWPTTPFVILASIVFAKANPKMNAWLLRSKHLGPYLENYHNKSGITMAYKIRAVSFMWAGMIFSMVLIEFVWVYFLLALIGSGVSWHIFVIKTRAPYPKENPWWFNIATCCFMWIWLGLALVFLRTEYLWPYLLLAGIGLLATLAIAIFDFKTRKSAN